MQTALPTEGTIGVRSEGLRGVRLSCEDMRGAFMDKIGMRLKEERVRLNYSQKDFASIGGVLSNAQSNNENERRSPSAQYLALLAKAGVDVLYVLTAQRFKVFDQDDFGFNFRQLPLRERRVITELVACIAKRA